ncbi:Fic family protein [Candidatus Uhrbacteria bacterium]|nr:Fic family protein [Candidatus Uhrbacteria bacterium]
MRIEVSPRAPERPEREARNGRRKTVERLEAEAGDREALHGLVSRDDLEPESALEILAHYDASPDKATREEVASVTERYGLPFDQLSEEERKEFTALYMGAKGGVRPETKEELAGQLDRSLHERLTARAFQRLDELRDLLTRSESFEQLKTKLRELMGAMSTLAGQVSPEKTENAEMWTELFNRFRSLVGLKGAALSKDIGGIFTEIFEEYQDFIENEFVVRQSKVLDKQKKPHSVEHLMRELFGRTTEEIEELKERNRANVAAYIEENRDESPSIEVLQELHRRNNDGIVPREYSRFRKDEEAVSFGRRFGIIPDDVKAEMDDFEARARLATVEESATSLYEITVAKLHNDFLDIHPFPDRNGSTALLFIEFMMAKRGYTPGEKRESKYYNHLWKALGNNPVAVGIVGHAHYKIANVPGYYEKGATTKGKEKMYQSVLNLIGQRKKEQQKKKK